VPAVATAPAGTHIQAMTGRDLVAIDQPKLKRDEGRVRRGFWPKLRRVFRHIPFAEDLLSAWYCAADRQTPAYVRAVLTGALAYFVIPADLIPDVIAGLGFTDDATVLLAALQVVSGNLKDSHREQAKQQLDRLAGEMPETE
jgi:uncharacterized membrane protein YkvA (DUF1232 family)